MKDTGYWGRYWNRKMNRRRLLRGTAVGATGLAAAAVVGCGDDEEAPAATTPAATATATPTGTPGAVVPKRGGKLVLARGATESANLDPWGTFSHAFHSSGPGIAYSRLVKSRTGPDVPPLLVEVVGDVAESWEQPDVTTFVVSLRPGVKWHNISPVNGRDLVADDVVYSFTQQLDVSVAKSSLGTLDTITAIDDRTLRLTSKSPNADFMADLTDTHNKIVPREAVELKGDLKEGPVIGSGPWIHKEWKPNETSILVRNPDYFLPGLPFPDELEFLRIADESTRKAAWRTGQVHDLGNINSRTADELKSEKPDAIIVKGRRWLLDRMDVSARTPPTDNIKVRQAITKGINRQEIIDTSNFGDAWLGAGITVPGPDWLLPDAEVKSLLAYDPEGARNLLKEAGFETVTIPAFVGNWSASQISWAELIQAQLKEVGIILDPLTPIDVERYISHFATGDYEGVDMGNMGLATTTGELLARHKSGGSQTFGHGLSDPLLDEWIDKQATLVQPEDETDRRTILLDIQRRVIELAAMIPIQFPITTGITQSFVRGYSIPTLVWAYEQWDDIWLDL